MFFQCRRVVVEYTRQMKTTIKLLFTPILRKGQQRPVDIVSRSIDNKITQGLYEPYE